MRTATPRHGDNREAPIALRCERRVVQTVQCSGPPRAGIDTARGDNCLDNRRRHAGLWRAVCTLSVGPDARDRRLEPSMRGGHAARVDRRMAHLAVAGAMLPRPDRRPATAARGCRSRAGVRPTAPGLHPFGDAAAPATSAPPDRAGSRRQAVLSVESAARFRCARTRCP